MNGEIDEDEDNNKSNDEDNEDDNETEKLVNGDIFSLWQQCS